MDHLAQVVREAREVEGLSSAELARRMGVSWDTVRGLEAGTDARLSTLQALIDAVPWLTPAAVLLGVDGGVPLASASAWAFQRSLFGFAAREVRLTARVPAAGGSREMRLEIAGVRPVSGSLDDEALRLNLFRAVLHGSPDLLRELPAQVEGSSGGPVVLADERTEHRFVIARAGRSFDYECSWVALAEPEMSLQGDEALRAHDALGHDVTYPVRTLRIAIEPGPGPEPDATSFAAPDAVVPAQGAVAFLSEHRPEGIVPTWDARRCRLEAIVQRPLVGLRHGIAWRRGVPASEGVTRASSTARSLPQRLRHLREASGVSLRGLATRMGMSPASVSELETGGDPRASTLRRWLEALPEATASDAFTSGSRAIPMSPASAWLHARALVGVVADEVSRVVTVQADGGAAEVMTTRGLRRLRSSSAPLVIKDGISAARHGRIGPVLLDQEGRASTLRVRWMRSLGFEESFQLIFPSELADAGASFQRSERKEAAYRTRPDQGPRSIGPAYECLFPAERLVLVVRFAKAAWPASVHASARAAVRVTNPRWPDVAPRVHGAGFVLTIDPKKREARLVVERPLMELRYSIRWEVAHS